MIFFSLVNLRKVWPIWLRKFLVALAVLFALYLAFQILGLPGARLHDVPTMALR